MKTKVLLANPRGFCAGVDRAIEMVELAIKKWGAPIYVRHEIVHNKFVVDELKNKGAIFVEDVSDCPDDRPIIFSAHGVAKKISEEAINNKLNVFDATCPLVTKVHLEALKLYNNGYHIFLIGHDGHPEIEGTRGQVPEDSITLIQTVEEAETVKAPEKRLAWLSQTTLSVDDTKEIVKTLTVRFNDILGPKKGDICYATTNRQQAVKEIAPLVEIMLVVGSENSSNSQRLVEVAQKAGCKKSFLISDVNFIDWNEVDQIQNIGLSSGASAPEILIEEIRNKFSERYEIQEVQNLNIQENVYFKLPKSLDK